MKGGGGGLSRMWKDDGGRREVKGKEDGRFRRSKSERVIPVKVRTSRFEIVIVSLSYHRLFLLLVIFFFVVVTVIIDIHVVFLYVHLRHNI